MAILLPVRYLIMDQLRSAIVGYNREVADVFSEALVQGGYAVPQRSENIHVTALGTYNPSVVMIDFDHLHQDKLEATRQLRFVLPNCAIAIVSSVLQRSWARQCHMAGASAVLDSAQSASELLAGLREADASGCFTGRTFTSRHEWHVWKLMHRRI